MSDETKDIKDKDNDTQQVADEVAMMPQGDMEDNGDMAEADAAEEETDNEEELERMNGEAIGTEAHSSYHPAEVKGGGANCSLRGCTSIGFSTMPLM